MRVEACSIGPIANIALQQSTTARVIATFNRSFYLQTDHHVICVADSGLYDGPINLLVTRPDDAPGWGDLGIVVGQRWMMGPGSLCSIDEPRVSIELRLSSLWEPEPLSTPPPDRKLVMSGLARLKKSLASRHQTEGLWRLVMKGYDEPIDAVERAATKPLQELGKAAIHWLRDGHPGITGSVNRLIGLGPGLTPSGDDLIAGLLIAAHYLGRRDAASALWHDVQAEAKSQTNAISLAHLSAAGQGVGAAPFHALLAASIENRTAQMTEALDAVAEIGHSSGFDAVAGLLILFDAWVSSSDREAAAA